MQAGTLPKSEGTMGPILCQQRIEFSTDNKEIWIPYNTPYDLKFTFTKVNQFAKP